MIEEIENEEEYFDHYLDEYYEYLSKEKEKFNTALDYYKENCIIPFEETEDLEIMDFESGDFFHVGYCEVIKTDYKNLWYPNAEYYKIVNFKSEEEEEEKINSKDRFKSFNFQKVKESNDFYSLVWQQTGCCEDDYSGYILFPMKDNKYWVVNFTM